MPLAGRRSHFERTIVVVLKVGLGSARGGTSEELWKEQNLRAAAKGASQRGKRDQRGA